MAVALVGPAPLDDLEELVREKFGPIVAKSEAQAEQATAPAAFGVEEAAVLEAAAASFSSSSAGDGAVVFRNPFPPRFMPPSSAAGNGNGMQHAAAAGGAAAAALQQQGGQRQGEPAVPIVRVVPLRDKRELRLLWALPPVRPQYRAPPTR